MGFRFNPRIRIGKFSFGKTGFSVRTGIPGLSFRHEYDQPSTRPSPVSLKFVFIILTLALFVFWLLVKLVALSERNITPVANIDIKQLRIGSPKDSIKFHERGKRFIFLEGEAISYEKSEFAGIKGEMTYSVKNDTITQIDFIAPGKSKTFDLLFDRLKARYGPAQDTLIGQTWYSNQDQINLFNGDETVTVTVKTRSL